jgi:ribose transport system ATP-binding protein
LASRGIATLVVSSDLLEIIALCDRVGVMHGGELVGALVGDAITEEAIMELAAR